jgi:hypothetical protein
LTIKIISLRRLTAEKTTTVDTRLKKKFFEGIELYLQTALAIGFMQSPSKSALGFEYQWKTQTAIKKQFL